MLHVRLLSGEVVTSIPVEELSDVRDLKRRLNQLHGLPSRFRQRLLLNDGTLEDADKLEAPLDLHLVILPFADVSRSQVNELAIAARQGCTPEAGSFEN